MKRPLKKGTSGAALARSVLPQDFWEARVERLRKELRKEARAEIPADWPDFVADELAGAAIDAFQSGLYDATEEFCAQLGAELDRREATRVAARAHARERVERWAGKTATQRRGHAARLLATEIERYRRLALAIEKRDARALHRLASGFNWDDGLFPLLQLVRSPKCSLGTALLVYWRGSPHHYARYAKRTAVPPHERATWELLHEIEQRMKAGGFSHLGIAYDPRDDGGFDFTRDEGGGKTRSPLPPFVRRATAKADILEFS